MANANEISKRLFITTGLPTLGILSLAAAFRAGANNGQVLCEATKRWAKLETPSMKDFKEAIKKLYPKIDISITTIQSPVPNPDRNWQSGKAIVFNVGDDWRLGNRILVQLARAQRLGQEVNLARIKNDYPTNRDPRMIHAEFLRQIVQEPVDLYPALIELQQPKLPSAGITPFREMTPEEDIAFVISGKVQENGPSDVWVVARRPENPLSDPTRIIQGVGVIKVESLLKGLLNYSQFVIADATTARQMRQSSKP